MKRDPRTPGEWQEAVNAAAACRAIADCKMYGLIGGGPDIDVARCDKLMERGKRKGVLPTVAARDGAIQMIAEINAEADSRQPKDGSQ